MAEASFSLRGPTCATLLGGRRQPRCVNWQPGLVSRSLHSRVCQRLATLRPYGARGLMTMMIDVVTLLLEMTPLAPISAAGMGHVQSWDMILLDIPAIHTTSTYPQCELRGACDGVGHCLYDYGPTANTTCDIPGSDFCSVQKCINDKCKLNLLSDGTRCNITGLKTTSSPDCGKCSEGICQTVSYKPVDTHCGGPCSYGCCATCDEQGTCIFHDGDNCHIGNFLGTYEGGGGFGFFFPFLVDVCFLPFLVGGVCMPFVVEGLVAGLVAGLTMMTPFMVYRNTQSW
eukprot:SM000020S06100  [mRNA]  locus=s20:1117738:1123428:+ [translate_table: standard]